MDPLIFASQKRSCEISDENPVLSVEKKADLCANTCARTKKKVGLCEILAAGWAAGCAAACRTASAAAGAAAPLSFLGPLKIMKNFADSAGLVLVHFCSFILVHRSDACSFLIPPRSPSVPFPSSALQFPLI